LTRNPSLDRTLEITELHRGEVLRATASRVDPGGKGINVARALALTGHPATAVVALGGREGEQLGDAIRDAGNGLVDVRIAEAVRTNLSLVEPDDTVTKVNAPGPRLTEAEEGALTAANCAALADACWLALCGSLPPGTGDELYAALVA